MVLALVKPSKKLLPSYMEAIQEGVYCNMALGFADVSVSEIMQDTGTYLQQINNPPPRIVKLPNGSRFKLTDHELFWITDGQRFIGTVSLRYAGDSQLIEEYAGHIGLAIRPSLLNKGYGVKATQQSWLLLSKIVQRKGLQAVIVTCSPTNTASLRLIEHNGGKLIKRNEDVFGTGPNLVYRIVLLEVETDKTQRSLERNCI